MEDLNPSMTGPAPAEYVGPMIDTEGRGAVLNREMVNGRLADVFREKKVRIVGSGFPNDVGPSRQEILEGVGVGDIISFRREPENAFDPNAIAADYMGDTSGPAYTNVAGRPLGPIGYIGKNLAAGIAADLDQGWEPKGLVYEKKRIAVRGVEEWAINVYIFAYVDETPEAQSQFQEGDQWSGSAATPEAQSQEEAADALEDLRCEARDREGMAEID